MKPLHQFKHIYNPYSVNVDNEQPSLYQEDTITDSVKPIPREDANIEVEEGEVLLKPDMSGLYKVQGKRHSEGGTPILAEGGSFVFSDFKELAIPKDSQEFFELKKFKGEHPQKNTPAEVLKKNIDVKHYNKMVNTLTDLKKDPISKKTAMLMLEKYQKIMGGIAYLQEERKNFRDGLPDVARDSAPVIDQALQTQIQEQEQYKFGGMTNPYLPSYQTRGTVKKGTRWGPHPGDKYTVFQDTNQVDHTNAADKIIDFEAAVEELGYTGEKNNLAFQNWLFDSSPENQAIIDKWHKKYNRGPLNGMFDDHIGVRWAYAIKEILENKRKQNTPEVTTETPDPTPELDENVRYLPYDPKVRKTIPMHIDEGFSGIQAAGVKKYNPYRVQVRSALPYYVDATMQGYINPIQQATENAYRATRGLSPYQAQNTIMEVYSKSVPQLAQIVSQVDDKNREGNIRHSVNIAGQQNQDMLQNVGHDKRFYDEGVLSDQRFENAKLFAWNQFSDVVNRNRETLDSLYQVLAQQPIAGSRPLYNKDGTPKLDKDGKHIHQSLPLYDVVPGTIRTRYTGVGNILNAQSSRSPQEAAYDAAIANIIKKVENGTLEREDALALSALQRLITATRNNNPYVGIDPRRRR